MKTMWRAVWTAGLAALSVAALPTPGAAQASPGEEARVLAVVDALFDGMRQKDEALLTSIFHEDAELHSTGTDASGAPVTRSSAIDVFIRNVVSSEAHLDEVTFDEVVLVDDGLAMAWTPYNLFVNGDFQHCGVDLFSMVLTVEGWKIVELVDTRRVQGCDPERRN